MDCVKADRYDQGHTTARRTFAAGFQLAGGKVTHIGATEQRKVSRYKKRNIYAHLPHNVFGVPYCRGSNKIVFHSELNFRVYEDSCRTALLIAAGGAVSLVAGILAAQIPLAAPILMKVSLVVGLGALYIGCLAATSEVQAVFLRQWDYIPSAGRQ